MYQTDTVDRRPTIVHPPSSHHKMAAISLVDRSESNSLHLLVRRNWASENPGVILVFCIVFVVGMGIVMLFAYRRWMKHKAKEERYETAE